MLHCFKLRMTFKGQLKLLLIAVARKHCIGERLEPVSTQMTTEWEIQDLEIAKISKLTDKVQWRNGFAVSIELVEKIWLFFIVTGTLIPIVKEWQVISLQHYNGHFWRLCFCFALLPVLWLWCHSEVNHIHKKDLCRINIAHCWCNIFFYQYRELPHYLSKKKKSSW